MDNFTKYLSNARMGTFKNFDPENYSALYLNNVSLCESFYPSIHFLEIILRNKISKALERVVGSDWLTENRNTIFDDLELENIKKSKQKLAKFNKAQTNDNIIAELGFGFWISLFHKKYEAKIWQKKGALQMVFSNNKKTGLLLNVKKIRLDLEEIKKLRNRIFHHEPIINMTPNIKDLYGSIYFYIDSMASDITNFVKEIDRFEQVYDISKKSDEKI